MTEINFYVSKEDGFDHRLAVVHRLVMIALQKKLDIHIHTDSETSSIKLDNFLWTKDHTSFIPHGIINSIVEPVKLNELEENKQQKKNQITISHDYEPFVGCDYLINFSNQRPAFFSRFLKVAEILDNTEEIITAGRKRYSFYRDRGYTLGYYKL